MALPTPAAEAPAPTAAAGDTAPQPQAWTAAEDKLLLRALLLAGGELTPEQLAALADQVGGAAAGRTADAVCERCLHVMQRYQEIRARKKAAAAGTTTSAGAAL